MFPSKISPQNLLLLALAVTLTSGCQVSSKWDSSSVVQNFPMNHAQSRPTSFIPVKYRVPAPDPSRVSVATAGRSTLLGVPLPSFGREQTRVAAIRETRPPWPQPVATYHPPVNLNPPPVSTPSVRGKVRLVNGLAIAPSDAPPVVHRAVAAGNRLQKMPYKWGGGHAVLNDNGYDCSGTVSYVLREAGLMKDQMPSRGFFNYGESGEGEWITVWVRDGHVFMIIGGLRLDTGGSTTRTGPRWKTKSRSYKGLVPRHPRGL